MVSSWCEALAQSAHRTSQAGPHNRGVRRPQASAKGVGCSRRHPRGVSTVFGPDLTQPGAPQQRVSAGSRPMLREEGFPPQMQMPVPLSANVCTVPFNPHHTATYTPKYLRSCLGRGGEGTPLGGFRGHHTTRSHTAADARKSLQPCLGRGGIGTAPGDWRRHCIGRPHTAAHTQ